MNGIFNGQILVDKLAKLNNSQQSIETLSHWCIFHRNKAKQVVETWDRQFHCSPQEQRVSYLYLANDILQNSRRKGAEFVIEFWKVLPDALNDVIENGDEFGKRAAMRLIDIWEERKVFGQRPQTLKEELLKRNSENCKRNGRTVNYKFKHLTGDVLEKIVSSYEIVYDGPVDEDAVLSKCRDEITGIEKMEKEIGSGNNSGDIGGPEVLEELHGHQDLISQYVGHLRKAESSRATLISHLREALQEQELKQEEVSKLRQAAESRIEQAATLTQQLSASTIVARPLSNHHPDEEITPISATPTTFTSEAPVTNVANKEQSAPVMYVQPITNSSPCPSEGHLKTTAAAVAEKLVASTSSAQMLTYVLSSLVKEDPDEYHPEKRPKLETPSQPPPPPFPHPSTHQNMTLPPPLNPPLPLSAPPVPGAPFGYTFVSSPQQPPPLPSYPMMPYQNVQGSDGGSGFFGQTSLPATLPSISKQ
ncbi:hypothetical protein QJS10_CPA10g01657 [Acorus calamus]|uniref:CID domain-containing protein n=1 Tax=Acorus calamus TaxID=4465 RepID=A0AAV9E030_ACOCL|nr:hypothetical protein QJS10_CPA10g01657 [Acorus calamus]